MISLRAYSYQATPKTEDGLLEVAPDVVGMTTGFVNLYFLGNPIDGRWMLIDTGLPGFAGRILRAAEQRFGGVRPRAILLTHGHFDHVGNVRELAEHWDVPIYAHPMELPYLTGKSSYPPPDPRVGGGAMAWMAALYPKKPLDLRPRIKPLPTEDTLEGFPDWRVIHTPGHAPGHLSLFRHTDRLLIAGDAVITVKQESLWAVMRQRPELHGPPAYYTPDWDAARASVRTLAMFDPITIASGHGRPLTGDTAQAALQRLADDFNEIAIPRHGRYVAHAAWMDEGGVLRVPPKPLVARETAWSAVALGFVAGAILGWQAGGE